MINTKSDRKNTLRRFLNENRTSLERDVDEMLDELWRLKRRISRSNKDTHYDVQKLIKDLEWFVTTASSSQLNWKTDLDRYLVSHGLPIVEISTNEKTIISTLDSF